MRSIETRDEAFERTVEGIRRSVRIAPETLGNRLRDARKRGCRRDRSRERGVRESDRNGTDFELACDR
ncbi:MAG: hypothetical protein NVSMB21_06800 [Vulcanimicrobiaceae bacterium]